MMPPREDWLTQGHSATSHPAALRRHTVQLSAQNLAVFSACTTSLESAACSAGRNSTTVAWPTYLALNEWMNG